MQCFIYKSLKKDELYLYLQHKDDFSQVPQPLLHSFGKLAFVMELELNPDRKLVRESVDKVMDGLKKQGVFLYKCHQALAYSPWLLAASQGTDAGDIALNHANIGR